MQQSVSAKPSVEQRKAQEPRWPSLVALVAVVGLHFSLPESLILGPPWLLLALVALVLVPAIAANRVGNFRMAQILGYLATGIVTADMILSLSLLIAALPKHQVAPPLLLRSAVALWTTNILIFASWYWRLDAGGPRARDLRGSHTHGDFLFPQMTIDPTRCHLTVDPHWRPGFIDYLFLAFNTSTAFSPTDVPVLSHWAKVLMMVQSTISFATVALLAARAVNIL